MSKTKPTTKFVDPMEALFTPPPYKTKFEALRDFFYDREEGSCFGRTPKKWLTVFLFYLVFYAGLAAFWAGCMWGLLQTIDEDTPTYILDSSIIGTSPGLASRPQSPAGRESVLVYSKTTKQWSSPTIDDLPSVDKFLEEYQEPKKNNTEPCYYDRKRQNGNSVCQVNISGWGDCEPKAKPLSNICMFFKINKVFEWLPEYYANYEALPETMPKQLKDEINTTFTYFRNKTEKVWLSCEGRFPEDKTNLGTVQYFPEQGFPGYYYPFRNQIGFKSPVVAMRIINATLDVVINLECRAWAPNIQQDRKEQIGVLSYKIKIVE